MTGPSEYLGDAITDEVRKQVEKGIEVLAAFERRRQALKTLV